MHLERVYRHNFRKHRLVAKRSNLITFSMLCVCVPENPVMPQ